MTVNEIPVPYNQRLATALFFRLFSSSVYSALFSGGINVLNFSFIIISAICHAPIYSLSLYFFKSKYKLLFSLNNSAEYPIDFAFFVIGKSVTEFIN